MKLLFVLKKSALNRKMNTGIENLAWGLAEYGMDIHIIAGGSEPKKHGYDLPDNVTYHFTEGNGKQGDHAQLYTQLRHSQYFDVVIGWVKMIKPLAAIEPINDRTPRFIANKGQGGRDRVKNREVSIGKIEAIVAISEVVKENVKATYKISNNRVFTIPRGVDTQLFYPVKDHNVLSSPPRLIYTGNINESKGVGDVVKALSMVDRPVELVLCGKGDEYVHVLKKKFKNHHITWIGTLYPEELRDQLQKADCFVFCSRREGLGKSLLEAMSCGLPVIVSDIAAFRGLVANYQNGLVASVKNPQHIAKAINTFLNDPDLRKKCGNNARQTIERNYTKNIELTRWIELLQKYYD